MFWLFKKYIKYKILTHLKSRLVSHMKDLTYHEGVYKGMLNRVYNPDNYENYDHFLKVKEHRAATQKNKYLICSYRVQELEDIIKYIENL